MTDQAILFTLNAVVKAHPASADGRRIVEVEASSEDVDSEGDVILQKALLDSAESFVKSGHLDIDHISEIGPRLGIENASSYIVGVPLEVKDIGGGRTSVIGEIRRASDGSFDVRKNRFDEFWDSLQSTPAVNWRASVYGFPKAGMIDDCSETSCTHGAKRYLIKGLEWRSLAFTKNPMNSALKGFARVVTAKAYISEVRKSMGLEEIMPFSQRSPRSLEELWSQYENHMKSCPMTEGLSSRAVFRNHFISCCGLDYGEADIMSHALMYSIIDRR